MHCPATGCADCAQLQLPGRATQHPTPPCPQARFLSRCWFQWVSLPEVTLTAAALTQSCLNCSGNCKPGHLKQITEPQIKNRTLKAPASRLLMDIRWENRPLNKHLHPRCGASPGRVAGLALLKERSQGHASWRQEAQSKGRLL